MREQESQDIMKNDNFPDDIPHEPERTEAEYSDAILNLCVKVDETKNNKFRIPGDPEEEESFWERLGLDYDDDVEFPETTEDEVKKALGRKWKANIRTLLKLAESEQFLTSSKHTIVLYFALTSGRLLDIFGNGSAIYHAIQLGIKCGLLLMVERAFFDRFDGGMNVCRLFAWSKKVEQYIRDIAKKNRIRCKMSKSARMKRAQKNHGKLVGKALDKTSGKPIKIAQSTMLPLSLTDDEIVDALRDYYPQLAWAQEAAIKLNEHLFIDEQISANPKITRAKKSISKIGFRITNPLVSAKEHNNDNDANFTGKWRKDVLEEKLGKWVEYDVKSSIYRVAYLINHGVWLPRDNDLYSMMSGFEFPTPKDRDNYKALAMKLYFDSSAGSIVNHLVCKGVDKGSASEAVVEEARKRMFAIVGKSLKSEIFLHEGCIYLEAFRRMVEERKWRVIQIYDCFYVRRDAGMDEAKVCEEVDHLVEDCACWYLDKFFGSSTDFLWIVGKYG